MLFLKQDSVNLVDDNSAPVGQEDAKSRQPRRKRTQILKAERIKRLYMRQLEGLTAKQLVLDLSLIHI